MFVARPVAYRLFLAVLDAPVTEAPLRAAHAVIRFETALVVAGVLAAAVWGVAFGLCPGARTPLFVTTVLFTVASFALLAQSPEWRKDNVTLISLAYPPASEIGRDSAAAKLDLFQKRGLRSSRDVRPRSHAAGGIVARDPAPAGGARGAS